MMRPIIQLPFQGFYDSWYSDAVDRELESTCENELEKEAESRAPELRLTFDEINSALFDAMDHSAAYDKIAKEYVASFDILVSRDLEIPLKLEFEKMESLREYNFTTDRVFAFTTHKAIAALFAMSKKDKHATLEKVIAERHTSYDGFMSYYENILDTWLAKSVRDWDHNELETLLLACCEIAGIRESLSEDCYSHMSDSLDFYQAFESAVDWNKYEAKCVELRADKLAELQAADPSYVAPAERCSDTLDLFRKD